MLALENILDRLEGAYNHDTSVELTEEEKDCLMNLFTSEDWRAVAKKGEVLDVYYRNRKITTGVIMYAALIRAERAEAIAETFKDRLERLEDALDKSLMVRYKK
ncbi:hypothetical protein GR28A_00164 [Vibrio phage vB_VcorM_GR28A]|nr:hypothetical protein GR28A_00164 [Vibrio phage vB_VcorM_GR28A]